MGPHLEVFDTGIQIFHEMVSKSARKVKKPFKQAFQPFELIILLSGNYYSFRM